MRRHLPKIMFLLALLLAGGCLALQQYSVLEVKGIEIIGSEKIDPAELGVAVGDNIFEVDTGALLESVTAHPFVDWASVRFDLQSNLILSVQEKQPICYIYSGQLYGVSAACELLPTGDSLVSLPVIQGIQLSKPTLYTFLSDAGLHSAIKLLNIMNSRSPLLLERISEIRVHDNGLELVVEPGTAVVDFGWGEYQRKLDMLDLVLASNCNPALRLDLRFGDMAIVKASDSNRRSKHGL